MEKDNNKGLGDLNIEKDDIVEASDDEDICKVSWFDDNKWSILLFAMLAVIAVVVFHGYSSDKNVLTEFECFGGDCNVKKVCYSDYEWSKQVSEKCGYFVRVESMWLNVEDTVIVPSDWVWFEDNITLHKYTYFVVQNRDKDGRVFYGFFNFSNISPIVENQHIKSGVKVGANITTEESDVLFDYYFSQNLKNKVISQKGENGDEYAPIYVRFDGRQYEFTEAVEHDKKPVFVEEDNIFLGTSMWLPEFSKDVLTKKITYEYHSPVEINSFTGGFVESSTPDLYGVVDEKNFVSSYLKFTNKGLDSFFKVKLYAYSNKCDGGRCEATYNWFFLEANKSVDFRKRWDNEEITFDDNARFDYNITSGARYELKEVEI